MATAADRYVIKDKTHVINFEDGSWLNCVDLIYCAKESISYFHSSEKTTQLYQLFVIDGVLSYRDRWGTLVQLEEVTKHYKIYLNRQILAETPEEVT